MGVKREPLQKQEFAQKGANLSILCWKKNQPASFSIKHGRNCQLPGLVAAYTSHSSQYLFQVRQKAWRTPVQAPCLKVIFLQLHSSHASPSLTQPKILLSCYTIKTSSLAFCTLQGCSSGRQEMPADSKCKAGGSVSPSHRADHTLVFLQTHTPAAMAWRPSC